MRSEGYSNCLVCVCLSCLSVCPHTLFSVLCTYLGRRPSLVDAYYTPRAMFRILSVTCLLTRKAFRLIGASLSEPHTYRTAVQNPPYCERSEPVTRVGWRIYLVYIYNYIYIYLYPWAHLVPRGPPVTRNAQMSDRPVEVQWSI